MCNSVCKSEHVESRGICQVSPATLYLVPLRLALKLPFFSESGHQQAPRPRVSILNTGIMAMRGTTPKFPWVRGSELRSSFFAASAPNPELPPS